MKKVLIAILTLLSITSVVSFSSKTVKAQDNEKALIRDYSLDEDFSPDKVLVVLKNSKSRELNDYSKEDFPNIDCEEVLDLTSGTKELFKKIEKNDYSFITDEYDIRKRLDINNYHQILLIKLNEKTKENVLHSIDILRNYDSIFAVEPSFYVHPCATPNEWNHLENNNKSPLEKIQMPDAWNTYTNSGNIKIGVIDSGIDAYHEDLDGNICRLENSNIKEGYVCIGEICDDEEFNPSLYRNSHGNEVAGIIGAVGNNYSSSGNHCQAIGVCWQTRLVSLRINGQNVGEDVSHFITAIDCATSKNIPILNCSYSSNQFDSMLLEIGNYPGLFICSAGNDGYDIDRSSLYPARFNLSNMITVGATDNNDNIWSDSNYGATSVDLFAPGVGIYTTFNVYNNVSNYGTDSGTSFSAPFVTGVAALILGNSPYLSPQDVKSIIMDNVDVLESLAGKCVSNGRLNAYKAINAGLTPKSLTGDVNGDGKEDIIIIREKITFLSTTTLYRYEFQVFLGSNACTFSSSPVITSTTITYKREEDVLAGDFNGDGKTDIVINSKNSSSKRLLRIFSGKSTGEFDYSFILSNYDNNPVEAPYKCIIADHDNDGKDDFIVVYKNASNKICMLLYKGTSALNPCLLEASSPYISSYTFYEDDLIFKGDFNGDGKDDILIHSYVSSNSKRKLLVYISDGYGSFAEDNIEGNETYIPSVNPCYYGVSDTNFDGKDDFVIYYKDNNGYKAALTYKGKSTSTYLIKPTTNSLTSTNYFKISSPFFYGDSNGDSQKDLITIEADGFHKRMIVVHKANLNYNFNSTPNNFYSNYFEYPLTDVKRCCIMKINEDARCDVVIIKRESNGYIKFYAYKGNTTGYTEAVTTTTSTLYYD